MQAVSSMQAVCKLCKGCVEFNASDAKWFSMQAVYIIFNAILSDVIFNAILSDVIFNASNMYNSMQAI